NSLFSGSRPRAVLTLAGLVVVIAGMKAAADPLVTLMLASMLAVLSLPLVTFLQHRRVPTVVAVLIAMLIDLAVLAGLAVLVTIAISEFTAAPEKYAAALQHLAERLAPMFRPLGFDLTHTSILDLLGSGTVAGVVGGTLTSAAAMFTSIVFVLLTMAFILNE